MTDITIRIVSTGAKSLNYLFTFQQQLRVTNQLVSEYNASVAFRQNDQVPWVTWRVQPTPQPQMQGIQTPDEGDSELTVTVEATGTENFTRSFTYACQYVEFSETSNTDKTLNFIPRNGNWWQWRLHT